MKRTLACLAALAVAGLAGTAHAESSDPIGDLISKTTASAQSSDMRLKSTLYHIGAKGVGALDSLGCRVSPMRTLAVDPTRIPRRTIVFIKETVGMKLPGGGVHDGRWYASDVGGAIKGNRVDLFTGQGRGSMAQFLRKGLSLGTVSAVKVGTFKGCPPR
jgi:3D (Asp-Asp-Asp) domain-containing protein